METATPFTWGGGGARMTPEQIAAQKKVAQALMEKGMDYSPIQSPWQGAARVAQALYGGFESGMADRATAENAKANQEMIASLLAGGGGATPATTGGYTAGPISAAPSEPQIVSADQFNSIDAMADLKPETAAMLPRAQGAIANIESGGRYDLKGPVTASGDQALGKYQVMGANVAPWTKEVMGKAMTPQEFLANPDAQDAVFNGKFGQYAEKYGAPGASKAWFAGEGGMKNPNAKDQLGTTVAAYADKFTGGMGDEGALPPNAQPTQATARPSGPMAGVNPKVLEAVTSPYSSPQTKAIATIMLQQQLKQLQQENDPLRQLQIKKAERDLADGKNPESVREYEYAKTNGFSGSFSDWIAGKRAGAGEYGLNAIWGKGPDGNPAIIQLGKGGKPILTPMPEGFQPNKDAQKVDLGTHWGILDPTTRQMVTTIPKDLRGKEREEVIGKGEGEAAVSLESVKSKMPGLEKVVGDLGKLSSKATYTLAGQGINFVGRQLGMEPREAAVARSNYISMVDNQVLPLLRDTFGAAFTVKEGDTLRNTLGDPDKTPEEKQVVLRSFIEQKRRDVEALERRVSKQAPVSAPVAAPVAAPRGKTSSGVSWSVE